MLTALFNTHRRTIAVIILLCVIPCISTIPVFCSIKILSFSEAKHTCPFLTVSAVSSMTIEDIGTTYLSKPEGYMLLTESEQVIPSSIFPVLKDKPPRSVSPA